MFQVSGVRDVTWTARPRLRRRGQWTPLYRKLWLRVVTPGRWLLFQWTRRKGYWLWSAGWAGTPMTTPDYHCPPPQRERRMKRRTLATAGAIVPALPDESVMFKACPVLRQFCAATQYDDGTPRQPGYYTFRNRGPSYELTLYDPDAGARVSVRHGTIDGVYKLAEQLLGAEDAPWEQDSYLMSLLAQKKKKK